MVAKEVTPRKEQIVKLIETQITVIPFNPFNSIN